VCVCVCVCVMWCVLVLPRLPTDGLVDTTAIDTTQNDAGEIELDGLIQNFAEEVVDNREWTQRVADMKAELARKYEGTIKELRLAQVRLKDDLRKSKATVDRLTQSCVKKDAMLSARDHKIVDLGVEIVRRLRCGVQQLEGAETLALHGAVVRDCCGAEKSHGPLRSPSSVNSHAT